MRRVKGFPVEFLIALLVFFALAYIGSNDRQEAQRAHAHHCRMVDDGHWPDYDGRVERGECANINDSPE